MAKPNFANRGPRFRPFAVIMIAIFAVALFFFFFSFLQNLGEVKQPKDPGQTASADVPPAAAAPIRAQITATRVNMRDAPSTQTGKVIHRFAGSEHVDVLDKTQSPDAGGYVWYKVRYESFTGWVYGQYAALEPEVVIQQ